MRYRFVLLFLLSAQTLPAQNPQKFTFEAGKMGTLIRVTVADVDSLTARRAADEVFALYDTLNLVLSDYLPDSELNRLCDRAGSGEWTVVSPHLRRVLEVSLMAYEWSGGAYDPSVGQVVRLWRQARKTQTFPDREALRAARRTQGFARGRDIELAGSKVRLNRAGVRLDFGGIAKGYAAQVALERLRQRGLTAVLIDSGGDVTLGEAPAGSEGWTVAVSRPDDGGALLPEVRTLTNCSLATSGSLYQSVDINGKTYSHIVNPRTGIGLTHQRNVTVLAADGATADWLATACSVLPFRKARRLIRRINFHPAAETAPAELMMAYRKGRRIIQRKTVNFK